MIKLDARRLTGINVIWDKIGAVVDVRLDHHEHADAVIALWQKSARAGLDAVGWTDSEATAHKLHSGLALAISAPQDALYAAVEVAEWIYSSVEHEFRGVENPSVDTGGNQRADEINRLREAIEAEANPPLQQLCLAAKAHHCTVLIDDDEVSIGLGKHSTTWPIDELPTKIEWATAQNIPVGLVTGTNGKTTTVRLTQRMLRAAGLAVGISSTDWIGVDDTIIDRGDYSGPGGARAILRQRAIDCAVLETARGGLLRRGLGMPRADAALITNIAEDHLGDFGSENLNELLDLKWIVTKALDQQSMAILNADDPMLVAKSRELNVPICWFGLQPDAPMLEHNLTQGKPLVSVVDQQFARYDGKRWYPLCAVSDAPITVGGSAQHNIANALGAIALANTLGCADDAIVSGLRSMQPNDNPGRCNFFDINGVNVLLDFAHNPSAMEAIFGIAQHHAATRRILCFGQAGDRTDQSIIELGELAWEIGLDHVFISELADYRRGRSPNEVFKLLSTGLVSRGAQPADISHCEHEHQALKKALEMAQPGDLVIMLALGEARSILDWLVAHDTNQ